MNAIGLVASRWPAGGVLLAHAIALATHAVGFGRTIEQLAGAFPELDGAALTRASRRAWSSFLRSQAVRAALLLARDDPPYPPIVPNAALARLEPPLILASFHVGPFQALGAVLERLEGEVLVMYRAHYSPKRRMTLVRTGDEQWERAAAFLRTARALRGGSFVFLLLDAFEANSYEVSTVDAPLLGGTIGLARGPLALARITGTPIVPLTARWRGGSIEVTVGEAISPSQNEAEMAAAASGWLEGYLRQFPGEAGAHLFDRIRMPPPR